MSNVDFPTTGAWGQTDQQREDGKTAYEVMEAQRNKKRDQVNRLEQVRDETRTFVEAIEKYAIVMGFDLPEKEVGQLRSLWTLHSKKCIGMTERLNDQRNALRRLETDLFNFRQRR